MIDTMNFVSILGYGLSIAPGTGSVSRICGLHRLYEWKGDGDGRGFSTDAPGDHHQSGGAFWGVGCLPARCCAAGWGGWQLDQREARSALSAGKWRVVC